MIFIAYAQSMPADKWAPIDSLDVTGRTVAENIRRLRGGMPYTELAEKLERLGRPIPTLGLRKIESGGRRVDVDDLVALAIALDVSPATLLMPLTTTPTQPLEITGWANPTDAFDVWDWLTAVRPLDRDVAWITFVVATWPIWRLHEFNDSMQRSFRVLDDEHASESPYANVSWRPPVPPEEAEPDGND